MVAWRRRCRWLLWSGLAAAAALIQVDPTGRRPRRRGGNLCGGGGGARPALLHPCHAAAAPPSPARSPSRAVVVVAAAHWNMWPPCGWPCSLTFTATCSEYTFMLQVHRGFSMFLTIGERQRPNGFPGLSFCNGKKALFLVSYCSRSVITL